MHGSMKTCTILLSFVALCFSSFADDLANPLIDVEGHKKATAEALELRNDRRLTVEEFIEYASTPGTVVLDTRSKYKFDMIHIKGAVHLNFSDFTDDTLSEIIPDKTTRVLIYCNNNFFNNPRGFPSKSRPAALNLPTFVALYEYGYKNVYELGPAVSVNDTKLQFEGSLTEKK